MMFLHCNKCFRLKQLDPQLQLVFSQCGHVICQSCASSKCAVCARPFKSVPIDKDMPASMTVYFDDPWKFYQRFLKVMRFQVEQQAQFFNDSLNKLPQQMSKLVKQQAGFVKLEARLNDELENEKKRIERLKAYIGFHERRREQPRHLERPIEAPKRSRVGKEGHRRSSNDYASISSITSNQRYYPSTPTLSLPDSSVDGEGSVNNAKMRNDFIL